MTSGPALQERSCISDSTRTLARVGALGVSYFGLTILLLSIVDTDYNPISQVASDYGVGRFAIEMNVGFLVGGIGLIALAWVIGRQEHPEDLGVVLFFS